VLTGHAAPRLAPGHEPASLESTVPGVFAVGDVRSDSVKRVGGAIGEARCGRGADPPPPGHRGRASVNAGEALACAGNMIVKHRMLQLTVARD
jgi:hypothetical protein